MQAADDPVVRGGVQGQLFDDGGHANHPGHGVLDGAAQPAQGRACQGGAGRVPRRPVEARVDRERPPQEPSAPQRPPHPERREHPGLLRGVLEGLVASRPAPGRDGPNLPGDVLSGLGIGPTHAPPPEARLAQALILAFTDPGMHDVVDVPPAAAARRREHSGAAVPAPARGQRLGPNTRGDAGGGLPGDAPAGRAPDGRRDAPGGAQAPESADVQGGHGGPPTDTAADPADLPRRDLLGAIGEALGREAHLLSRGERVVVDRLLSAPREAQSLFARLLPRRPRVFWLDELAYTDVPEPGPAVAALAAAGLAWRSERIATPAMLAGASTVPQLRAAARRLGRPVSGDRAALVARCADPEAAALLRRPGVVLRHTHLIHSLTRLALLDHRGDLGRFVLARLGHTRPAAYRVTGGAGLFGSRAAWLRYEAGLALRQRPGEVETAPLFSWLERFPPAPAWRSRHSGRRFAEDRLYEALRAQERAVGAADAARDWRRMLDAGPRAPGPVVARLALALGRAGDPAAGAALCEAWMPRLSAARARALEPTARRLGRASGRGHRPLPPLRPPPTRRLSLAAGSPSGPRPRYRVGDAEHTVEAAVVAALAARGRLAFHGEGSPWSTLFGVIFRDALFASVPGMLPGPLLRAPLDLGTPGFRARRRTQVARTLDQVRAGGAPDLIRGVLARHGAEDIRGVDWRRFPPRGPRGPRAARARPGARPHPRGLRRRLAGSPPRPARPVRAARAAGPARAGPARARGHRPHPRRGQGPERQPAARAAGLA